MTYETQLWIERHPWSDRVEFVYAEKRDSGLYVAEPIILKEKTAAQEGEAPPITFALRTEKCQELMDRLWQLGLRPSEGTGSAGALAATQKHLDDMRKLVFEQVP
jgi:hypothetical protein